MVFKWTLEKQKKNVWSSRVFLSYIFINILGLETSTRGEESSSSQHTPDIELLQFVKWLNGDN